MFKRALIAVFCSVIAASMFTSCGKEIKDSKSDTNTSNTDNAVSDTTAAGNDDKQNGVQDPNSPYNALGEINISRFSDRKAPEIDLENSAVKNFTTPEKGEKIVIMKFKDYEGEVKIRLFPEYAELGVENFVGLAEQGYYDGLTFHRIVKDFMIQGGDPNGTGTGGESIWGDKFDGGTNENVIHAAGTLAYANSGSTATNGSQFYIVTGETFTEDMFAENYPADAKEVYKSVGGSPWLDGSYTIFGQVYDGLDIIFSLQDTETYQANAFSNEVSTPVKPVEIEYVKVGEYNGEELKWFISDYN